MDTSSLIRWAPLAYLLIGPQTGCEFDLKGHSFQVTCTATSLQALGSDLVLLFDWLTNIHPYPH